MTGPAAAVCARDARDLPKLLDIIPVGVTFVDPEQDEAGAGQRGKRRRKGRSSRIVAGVESSGDGVGDSEYGAADRLGSGGNQRERRHCR